MKSAPATRNRASWVFRNTDRVHRIRYLLPLYARTLLRSLGRVPVKELVRTQFPFWMQDAPTPPTISLELTNHCNLRCSYCTNPTTLRPRGVMGERTFRRLLDELALGGIYSVGICGVFAMWNSPLMRQYREGHRRRLEEMIPVCRGCPGRT